MSGVIRRRQMRGSVENVDPATLPNKYLTFYAREAGTFSFSHEGLHYSLDGKSWKSLGANTQSVIVPAGSYIYFRGKLPLISAGTFSGVGTFSSSGAFDVLGNINSLVYDKEAEENTGIKDNSQYYNLFASCSNLINATSLKLPSEGLRKYCYSYIFTDCTNLISAPKLEATVLAEGCYKGMFNRCQSLHLPPRLPATTLSCGCYGSMFCNCFALAKAPELPAMTLSTSCYQEMFYNCQALTTMPELPATTLEDSCYYGMFRGCINLVNTKELPATELAPYCYQYLFRNCSKVNYIKALFVNLPNAGTNSSAIYYWAHGVSSTGTFVKNSAATWTDRGVSGIPNNWTIQTIDV